MCITIGDLLNLFITMSTYDGVIETKVDPERLRPSDVTLLYGDSTKFHTATGWKPKFSINDTMGSLLDAWRKKIAVYKMMR